MTRSSTFFVLMLVLVLVLAGDLAIIILTWLFN
jgi:hypothetical protein